MEPIILLYALLALLLLLIFTVIIRTLLFKPKPTETLKTDEIPVDTEKAVADLAQMIRCRTVSHFNKDEDDEREFSKFVELLPTLFPEIYKKCEYTEVNDRALLFKLCGRESGSPSVFMAHYDVVSADEERWQKPPFDGVIENGVLWGRGALDTKVTLNAAMQALEALLKSGFEAKRDIYFAFAGDEEINGGGASSIVDYFEKEGITPSLVLDEGGAVVNNVFPGVKTPCAMVGIAEKGMLNVELSCKSNGGHSSAPKPHTPVSILSRACTRIEGKPFKMRISGAASSMFNTLARHSSFFFRMIFANLFIFSPVLDLIGRKTGGELNALMRTTCAFTQMKGSDGMNVIPTNARMVANLRINPGETVETAVSRLKRTVNDDRVNISVLYGNDPSRVSLSDCDGYKRVERAILSTWENTISSPYLMVACSDSRHWGRICDRVYRFSAMALTGEERASIHGNDERIPYDTVRRSVEFYTRLIKEC